MSGKKQNGKERQSETKQSGAEVECVGHRCPCFKGDEAPFNEKLIREEVCWVKEDQCPLRLEDKEKRVTPKQLKAVENSIWSNEVAHGMWITHEGSQSDTE